MRFPSSTFHNNFRYLTAIAGPWFLVGLTFLASRWAYDIYRMHFD